jgi:hypothetical protein
MGCEIESLKGIGWKLFEADLTAYIKRSISANFLKMSKNCLFALLKDAQNQKLKQLWRD